MNRTRRSSILVLLLACLVLATDFRRAPAGEAAIQTYPMQAVAPTVAAILGVPAPKQAESPPIDAVVNDLRGSKKVAILGIDAFGAAIWANMRQQTPYLNGLAHKTNRAQLRSVLPSVTCVNFACMITGGSQKATGVKTFDSVLACEDLCSVLRTRGMKSGGFGITKWTGDRLLGRYADFSVRDKANDQEVLAGLMEIVDQKKPEFVIVQFGETDDVFHRHGPSSIEAREACGRADAWLAKVVPWLRARGYAIIITADHGQHDVQNKAGKTNGKHGSDSDVDCLVPLVWLRSGDSAARGFKVYIATDMEGCSGITGSEQIAAEEGKQLMAGDMNACIEGCFAAGATEVVVRDIHGGGRNVDPAAIDRRARLIQGATPGQRFHDFEGSAALILLGYHAKALTPGGTLAHSFSSASIQGMWLDGWEVGEIGIDAAIAAEHKVPVVMVAGDDKTCEEARAWIPGVVTCQTKKGTGPQSAEVVPLEDARRLITQKTKEAVARRNAIPLIKIGYPATIRWDYLPKGSSRQISAISLAEVCWSSLCLSFNLIATARKKLRLGLGFSLGPLDGTYGYLKERGLTAETIATFGIGCCAHGSLRGWIAIPIHDAKGKLVAYAGRWPGEPADGIPKYRLPRGFRKSLELFNQHRAANANPSDRWSWWKGSSEPCTCGRQGIGAWSP